MRGGPWDFLPGEILLDKLRQSDMGIDQKEIYGIR